MITGASSGIGTATAYALARRGAAVVLAARSEPALLPVAQRCRELGGRALVVPTDVTDLESVRRLADQAAAEFGRIDAWVNNAAVSAVGLFDEIPVAEFRRVLEVNLLGAVHGIKAALPYLSAAGGGVLVNNASVLAEVAMPYQSAYNATKHGIRGWPTRSDRNCGSPVAARSRSAPSCRPPSTPRSSGTRPTTAGGSWCRLLPCTRRRWSRRPSSGCCVDPAVRPTPVVRPGLSACSGGWRPRWWSAPSAGTPTAPSSVRAPGWTPAATCSTPTPRPAGTGLARSAATVGADDRRVRSRRRRHRCRHHGRHQPPLPVGPLMARIERPNALTVPGAHNGAIMSSCLVETDESSAVVRLTGVLDAAAAEAVRGALLTRLCDRPGPLVADVTGLRVVDSVGRGVFADVRREVADWPAADLLLSGPGDTPDRVDAALAGTPAWPTTVAGLPGWPTTVSGVPTWPTVDDALAAVAAAPLAAVLNAELTPTVGAARLARELIATGCERWGMATLTDPASIAVTEMVNNVVAHAGPR
ncbi:SDR family NAD(P)-dependent oxidoreductase [Micromonospora sp. M12]